MKVKVLYIFIPISIVLFKLDVKLPCFIATVLSIIALSYSLCNYTELLSKRFGDKIGGMINATMGNIPELVICFFALKAQMYDLVKAGLIGSILGNILLVQGISIFWGGLKYNEQRFNKTLAKTNIGLLFLALTGVIITSIYNYSYSTNINKLSLCVAIILIAVYLLGLIFSLITHKNLFIVHYDDDNNTEISQTIIVSKKFILSFMFIFTFLIIQSDILVENIQYISNYFEISQSFLGIILVPLVGNIAESMTAIIMALKNRVSLCIEIAVGSSMQIALFVLPVLTIIGYFMSTPLSLVFNIYYIASLIISIGLSFFVFQDGKTYWIEGAILLSSYFIIALGFYFM